MHMERWRDICSSSFVVQLGSPVGWHPPHRSSDKLCNPYKVGPLGQGQWHGPRAWMRGDNEIPLCQTAKQIFCIAGVVWFLGCWDLLRWPNQGLDCVFVV